MDMIAEILGKMNTVVTIISFIVIAIFLFLLYMAYGKIRDLEKAKANLIKSFTAGDSVCLTSFERQMILMAIDYKPYRDMISLPQTKRFVRDVWRGLREKIKASIKEGE